MWKWNGKGFMLGIPARDLSDEEARKIGINRVKASGLYEHKRDKKPAHYKVAKEQKWQEQEHSEKSS